MPNHRSPANYSNAATLTMVRTDRMLSLTAQAPVPPTLEPTSREFSLKAALRA